MLFVVGVIVLECRVREVLIWLEVVLFVACEVWRVRVIRVLVGVVVGLCEVVVELDVGVIVLCLLLVLEELWEIVELFV